MDEEATEDYPVTSDGGMSVDVPCSAIDDGMWPWPVIPSSPKHAFPTEPAYCSTGAVATAGVNGDDVIMMTTPENPHSIHPKPEPHDNTPPAPPISSSALPFCIPSNPCPTTGFDLRPLAFLPSPKHAFPPDCDADDGDVPYDNAQPPMTTTTAAPLPSCIPAIVLTKQQKAEKYGLPKHLAPAELREEISGFENWSMDKIELNRPERFTAIQSTTFGKQELHMYAYLGFCIR